MKKLITGAMTGLLLASAAAPALAQEGWRDHQGRVYGARGNQIPQAAPQAQAAPQTQTAPQAQPAPQAAPAQPGRNWSHGDGQHNWTRGGGDGGQHNWAERHDRGDGQRTWDQNRERNWNQNQNRALDQNRDRTWDQNRNRTWDQSRQRNWDQGGNRNDRRDDRRDWDRDRNRDGRTWQGRDWSDRDRERPRYERRYYPPVYHAQRRYHAPSYRLPYGYYDRTWVYGDILPGGWYGQDNWLDDWGDYGLPIPPAGYEWVRVGDDALLVDTFSGRVVQVVYDLFW